MFLLQTLQLAIVGSAALITASPSNCAADNCERAFNGDSYTLAAASFCSKFTTATILTTEEFPAHATPACSLVAQISSICSCAYPARSVVTPKITPTSSATENSCTISCPSVISSNLSRSISSSISGSLSSSIFSSLLSSLSSSLLSINASISYSSSAPASVSSSILSSSSQNSSSPFNSSSVTAVTTIITTMQTSTVSSSIQKQYGPDCNADNCLRAFDRGNGEAFCSLFTLGKHGAPALPTYATQCTGRTSARVSSACTCLNYHANPTPILSSISPANTTASTSKNSSKKPIQKPKNSPSKSSRKSSNSKERLSTSIRPTAFVALTCNADNCLRAMEREGGVGATAFCSSFTAAVVTKTGALPTYQTQCTTNPILQISSACSCLLLPTGLA